MRMALNIIKDIFCFISAIYIVWMLNSLSIYYKFVPVKLVITALTLEAMAGLLCLFSIKKSYLGSLSVMLSLLAALFSIDSYYKCNKGWLELRNFTLWTIIFIIAPLLSLIAKHIDKKD